MAGSTEVLVDERGHLVQRLLSYLSGKIPKQSLAFTVEDGHVDLSTGLKVLCDKLVQVWMGCAAS